MNIRKKTILVLLLIVSSTIQAQIQHAGLPIGFLEPELKSANLSLPTVVKMPAFDSASITPREEGDLHKTLQFAHAFKVNLSPDNCGEWHTNGDGSRVWQVTITSDSASSINVIFDKFKLPQGGKIFIYNTTMTHVIGAFTDANNKASGILPTLPVMGSKIIVEYQEPLNAKFNAEILIGQVNHDYTNIFNQLKTGFFGDSQSCEKDVSCYVDELYLKTRRSTVKIIINGTELMTGTLINNTAQDGTPYILTASHGFEAGNYSADGTLFLFNHQVPLCFNDVEGTREQSIAGGTVLSYSPDVNNTSLDLALVVMSVQPPTAYQAYYAGWNRSSTSPTSSFCIHHPQGDVKKISFDDNILVKRTLEANGITYYPYAHWNVQRWEVGVTEGGSSGSGLFNPQGQLIGALSAGAATCSSPTNDYFYRFDLAWNAFPENNRQLAHWLDPSGLNATAINAYETPEVLNTERVTHILGNSDVTIVNDANSGNIAGTNHLGISHFVEKFTNSKSKNILGLYFIAAEGNSSSVVNISIWTGNDRPENEIYNEVLLIKNWNYNNYTLPSGTIGGSVPKRELSMQENFVMFTSPITVSENYFIGFEVNNNYQSNPFGLVLSNTSSADNAFYYDSEWHSYLDLANYNKATTLWIDPVVKNLNATPIDSSVADGINVFPNPVKNGELLTVKLHNSKSDDLKIYDLLGRSRQANIIRRSTTEYTLNTDNLTQGIFILKAGQEQILFQKL